MKNNKTWIALSSILAMLLLSPILSASAAASTGGALPLSHSSISGSPAISDPPLSPTPLYAISGDYSYQAAGAALRDQGYGTITVTYTGSLVKAYLIWTTLDDTLPGNPTLPATAADADGSINGHAITGVSQGTDVSPCWPSSNIFAYAADVTPYVTSGANSLTGFASGDSSGGDPWSDSYVSPAAEGATLIVVTTGATSNDIYLYTGTQTNFENPITSTFTYGAADATTATTTYIVGDGQFPGNYAVWNGVTIDSNAFPGSDPKASSATWSNGNLWDTKTYSVSVALGSTSATAQIGSGSGDCITWAGQVLSIPSIVPITGVPQFGLPATIIAPLLAVLLLALRPVLLRKSTPQM